MRLSHTFCSWLIFSGAAGACVECAVIRRRIRGVDIRGCDHLIRLRGPCAGGLKKHACGGLGLGTPTGAPSLQRFGSTTSVGSLDFDFDLDLPDLDLRGQSAAGAGGRMGSGDA